MLYRQIGFNPTSPNLTNPIVKNGYIDVWDKPGLGITFNVGAAKARLTDEDRNFFD
jgi:L-alanine-DL-glutamate epimerase-like enolase superfamily enzyme